MMKIKTVLLSLTVALPSIAFATVGGPQTIEVLGYDASDQKVYILRHFYDGRGRLPQLSYYLLGSQQPHKSIDVSSLYINPHTQQVDYDQDPQAFNQALAKIKSRLHPLPKIPTTTLQLDILQIKQQRVNLGPDLAQNIQQYQYCYQLKKGILVSPIQTATSYKTNIQVSQSYQLPQHNQVLAVVKYQGIPIEGGYDIEDAMILK